MLYSLLHKWIFNINNPTLECLIINKYIAKQMKNITKIALLLIIASNWAVLPGQAYTTYKQNCPCCNKNICVCDEHCNGLSDQSLSITGHNAKSGNCNFNQCKHCSPHRKAEETFLLTDASSEVKKKPVLIAIQTTLPNNMFVLDANTASSIYSQLLLSSSSLFLLNDCPRL